MKSLSRQEVIRWIKSQPQTISKSSGGSSGSGGGVSQSWVEENYISKEFFSHLFTIHSTTSGTDVTPNDTDTAVGSIEAMFGLWTEQFISALGQGSGGSGGSASLAGLVDVELSTLEDGQVLMWDEPGGKWVNADISQGSSAWADITGKPTTISGYGITDAKIENGTITLDGNTITPIPISGSAYITGKLEPYTNNAHDLGGSSYRWRAIYGVTGYFSSGLSVNGTAVSLDGHTHSQYLTGITAAMINSALGFTMSGTSGTTYNLSNFLTGITSAMVTTALGFTPLSNATTFWGRTASGGAVSGSMTGVGSITMSGNINTNNAFDFNSKDSSDNSVNLMTFNNRNELAFGYGARLRGYEVSLQGGTISLSVNSGYSDNTDHNLSAFYINANGQCYVPQGAQGLRIGDGLITWDSANNALKIQKSDGTAANLYALGGVSALGFYPGSDAATVSHITTNLITFPDSETNDCTITHVDGNLVIDTDDNSGYVKVCDICSNDGSLVWRIAIDGEAHFSQVHSPKFYLTSTKYIYLDNGTLKYYDGSTSKTIVLS